jgi:hypothetical protein
MPAIREDYPAGHDAEQEVLERRRQPRGGCIRDLGQHKAINAAATAAAVSPAVSFSCTDADDALTAVILATGLASLGAGTTRRQAAS